MTVRMGCDNTRVIVGARYVTFEIIAQCPQLAVASNACVVASDTLDSPEALE